MGIFKDIKVGDKVFTKEVVKYGWNSLRSFEIKEEVVRITKTQFVTETGVRYNKERGNKIGAYGHASLTGKDESEQLKEFKSKITKANKIYHDSGNINISVNADMNDLKLIEHHLNCIKKITSKYKESNK